MLTREDDAFDPLRAPQSPAGVAAWPEGYAEASRSIAAEAENDPHDPRRYWDFFPGTD